MFAIRLEARYFLAYNPDRTFPTRRACFSLFRQKSVTGAMKFSGALDLSDGTGKLYVY